MADDIRLQFGADTSGADAGIEKVKGELTSLKDPIQSIVEGFEKLKDTIIDVFAIEQLAAFTEKTATMGAEINRLQIQFGMSAQQVQGWMIALQAAGEGPEALKAAIIRLQENISLAIQGSGRQRAAFQDLGITVNNLKDSYGNMNGFLELFAERFKQTGADSNRVADAYNTVGRGVANLIPLFAGGAEAIEKFQKDAEEFAIPQDSLDKLADTEEKIAVLSAAFRDLAATIATDLKPIIDVIIAVLQDFSKNVVDVTTKNENLEGIVNLLALAMGGLYIGIMTVVDAFRAIIIVAIAAGDALSGNFARAKQDLGELQGVAKDYVDTLNKITSAEKTAGSAAESFHGIDKQSGSGAPSEKYQEDIAFDKQDLADKLALDKVYLDQHKIMDETLVAEGKLTKEQSLADQKNYLTDQLALEQQALTDEYNISGQSTQQYQKILDDKELLTQKYNLQIDQLNLKSLQAQQAQYHQFFESISQAFSQMIQGMLQGTQTWQQLVGRLFDNLLAKFIDDFVIKRVTAWAESELTMTAATTTGASARVAAQTTADAAGDASHIASATKSIIVDSKTTFAGVYADLSPYLGPLAAIPALAAEGAVAAAASFDVGSYDVPGDMLANIHQGEMIIPKTFADSLRENGGFGGGGGQNIQVTINAVDAQSVQNLLKSNSGTIAQIVQQNVRNFNSHTVSAMRA